MIDNQDNKIFIMCDSCTEVFEGDEGMPWTYVWAIARRAGWRARKLDEQWLHACPRCGRK